MTEPGSLIGGATLLAESVVSLTRAALIVPLLMRERFYVHGPVRPRRDDIIIDAGANVGLYACWAARRLSPWGRVWAFEPEPKNYARLRRLVACLALEAKVKPVPLALGAESGQLRLELVGWGSASGAIEGRSGKAATVEKTTIDHFVAAHDLPYVSFIKMDIEGMEREALAGACRTITTWRPRLAVCTYHLPDDPEVIPALIGAICPGYRIIQTRSKLYAWHPKEHPGPSRPWDVVGEEPIQAGSIP
ncbi:MAG TPA: hypothetical protein DCM14_09180 [Clostridiales bacterium UBA8153]|nr:hypothetical protein [Clostridiales bacterium UBA8153]